MQIVNKSCSIFADIKNKIIAFDRASKRNQRITYYLAYTAIFCFLAFAVYFWFMISNKSFIWHTDGINVNYPFLLYYGDYLRNGIHGFLTTGTPNFPMWDFHIGYGSDVLTTLNFVIIGDPLNLLSVFFKGDSNEILYNALVVLRVFLAGIAFSAYCRKMGKSRFYTLIGAFLYAFCGFSIFTSVRHPYFINPMIYLPLILIGVERILEKRKPYLLIVMVCVSAISNFYFFYMMSILTVMYAIIRFLTYYKENRAKQFFKTFAKFCGSYGVGVLLAAIVFLPTVIAFTSNGRQSLGYSNNFLFYPVTYYQSFIASYITIVKDPYWAETGYTSIAVLAILLMFCSKKRKGLKLSYIILTLFLLIPVFGYIFNGFSYITNRWIFGYSFLVSFITVEMLPEFFLLDNKKKAVLAISPVVLYVFCAIYYWKVQTIVITGIFTITAFAIIIFNGIYKKKGGSGAYKTAFRVLVFILALGGIIFNAGFRYSPEGKNYVAEFIDSGKGIQSIENTPNAALKNVNDSSFYRVETDYNGGQYTDPGGWHYNDSLLLKYNSTNIYNNLISNNLSGFFKELGGIVDTNLKVYQLGSLDCRAGLSAITGVKYYTVEEGRESYVPFGFSFLSSYKGYKVYKNENALPLGFTYSSCITREDYENMTMNQKQQAFLQGVVLDNPPAGYEKTNPVFNDVDVPFDVKCGDGVSYAEGCVTVTKESAEMTLSFKGIPDAETYVIIKNLWYDGKRKYSEDRPKILVVTDKISKNINYRTEKDSYYTNIHDFMVNMGYSKDEQTCFKVYFVETGEYTFDSMKIICSPMEAFSGQINSLKTDYMKDVVMKNDYISGEVDLNSDKILCLSVPYSEGWNAKVNGESVKILKANTMFTAIPLKAGKNIIELKYMTPGLKYGAIISGITLLAIIGISIYINIKKRKKKPEQV